MMVKLRGFAPDADATAPGILTDCTNLIPTERGMAGGPAPVVGVQGLAPLAAACRGAAVAVNTAGARRIFAGTQTALYELVGAAWTNVSRAANYTGSTESRWAFAQFGNAAIACDGVGVLQATTGGAFADIATAPAARIVIAAKDFVLAFDTEDATYGDRPDAWWCSAFQNHALWTPDVATQATTGRLVGTPGPITAAAMLGSYAVAYKERGAYLGQHVGPPIAWQWDAIPAEFGCVGPEAVCDVGGAHFVVGPDDVWLFDGTRPVSVAAGVVREWLRSQMAPAHRHRTIVSYERSRDRVWVFFPSSSSAGALDRALVYHLPSKRWGRADRAIEAVFTFVTPGITWDTLSSLGTSWDALPNVPWDSPTWQVGGRAVAVFDANHDLRTLNGVSTASAMVTGDIGDDWTATFVSRVALRFHSLPTAANAEGFTREMQGDDLTARNSAAWSDNVFTLTQDGRWHRFAFAFTGEHELSALDVETRKTGRR